MNGTPVAQATIRKTRIYEAYEDLEKNEGRGGIRIIGHFENKALAEEAGRGMGVMGYDNKPRERDVEIVSYIDPVTHKEVTRLLGAEIVLADKVMEIRARAIAKLTAEEREALGLK